MIRRSENPRMSSGISPAFAELFQIRGWITHALLTRAPLYSPNRGRDFSCDLHVLSTPPAFILSQDQTLQLNWVADCSANQTLGPEFRHCLVFKDRARRPAGPRSSNPAKISNRRVEVKRFFSRPAFFRAAKTPAISKNPANISEDRIGVKRFFFAPRFFRLRTPLDGSNDPRAFARPRRSARPAHFRGKKNGRTPATAAPPKSGRRPLRLARLNVFPKNRPPPRKIRLGNGQNGNDFYRIEPDLSNPFFNQGEFFGPPPPRPSFYRGGEGEIEVKAMPAGVGGSVSSRPGGEVLPPGSRPAKRSLRACPPGLR